MLISSASILCFWLGNLSLTITQVPLKHRYLFFHWVWPSTWAMTSGRGAVCHWVWPWAAAAWVEDEDGRPRLRRCVGKTVADEDTEEGDGVRRGEGE
ncbi:hypothetical protein CIPAW_11G047200 [Carya illinoinensis]|uniref:Secreted protein n=1 Tax=Carya illinoinensis TaxID=32201 RepID=A0A8T1NV73_CARIL|nr:hypothetical protein CIPAW_11G047200 [Carya illinoinensis]